MMTFHRLLPSAFAAAAIGLAVFGVPSALVGSTEGRPPESYQIEDVRVIVTHTTSMGAKPVHRVTLSGGGEATLEQDNQTTSFLYESKDLLSVLNQLYGLHFFDLPSDYRTSPSVVLSDDGVVRTRWRMMTDASTTSVCFSVGDYEKCVRYADEGPSRLVALVRSVFDEADKRTR